MPKEKISDKLVKICKHIYESRISLNDLKKEIPTDLIEDYEELDDILSTASSCANLLEILYRTHP